MPRRSNAEAWTPKSASRKHHPAPQSGGRVSKTPLFCRTCARCRTKKVKCNGDRPSCASCLASDEECHYPEDARRSNRTTKADTTALQNEIFLLRQLITDRQQPDSNPEGGVPTRPFHGGEPLVLENSSSYDTSVNINGDSHLLDPAINSANVLQHTQHDSQQFAPSAVILPTDSYVRSPVDAHHRPRTCSNSTPKSPQQARQGPSPQDIYITGTVTDDGRVQAYGVTSTLHEPPAVLPQVNSPVEDEEAKILRRQLIRDQLVANAVIQRQRETSIHMTPQIQAMIELDGVAPDLAFHLFNLHWNRQHYSYLLTYRPAIMDSLMNRGPHANLLLLNAIYYSSSLYCDSGDMRSAPNNPLSSRFYRRFKQLLADEIDQPSIPTAVALLLCGASLVSHGKQSAGWVLCGTAYRMIIDLGCHLSIEEAQQHKTPSRAPAIEFELRKRVYWGAFMTDKFQSLYLGRTPALRSSEAQLPKDLLDSYEELELWEPYTGSSEAGLRDQRRQSAYQPRPAYAVSTFTSLLELAEIANEVINAFYSKEGLNAPPSSLRQAKIDLERRLDDWQRELPAYLHFDPNECLTPPPHQITLHTTYWTMNILLERPFLRNGHLGYIFDPANHPIGEEKCASSVLQIWSLVKAYRESFTLRRAPYLLCYATYSAVLVILQQMHQHRERFSECVPFFWTALLDLQQGCNAGLKKPLNIIKTLMRRLGDDIPQFVAILDEKRTKQFSDLDERNGNLETTTGAVHSAGNGATGHYSQQQAFSGDNLLSAEMLQSLDLDISNIEQWLHTSDGNEGGLLDDSMYGLFTS